MEENKQIPANENSAEESQQVAEEQITTESCQEPEASTFREEDGSISAMVRVRQDDRVLTQSELKSMLDDAYKEGRNSAFAERIAEETSVQPAAEEESGIFAPFRRSIWD